MKRHAQEIVRYILNGLFATAVHYALLHYNVFVLQFSSYGLANLLAAAGGITTSFLGSRYFVFPNGSGTIVSQALRFGTLYAVIAICHGLVLLLWSDWLRLDHRIGFLLATGLQVSISYLGNKKLVFSS